VALIGLALAAVACCAQITAQFVDYWAFDLRFDWLNGNSASSAFAWVSGAAILGTALAFARIAIVSSSDRRTAVAIACLFTFLLVDNRVHIHERLNHGKLLFLPLLGVTFVLLWRFSARQSVRERRLVHAGLAFLLVSLLVALLGPTVLHSAGWTAHDWQYQVKVAIKEGTEKAGWILVCFGALASLQRLGKGPG